MDWKGIGAIAFLLAALAWLDVQRVMTAAVPQPGWPIVGTVELGLLFLAPRVYRLWHSAKQMVQISRNPILWGVLGFGWIFTVGLLDDLHALYLPPRWAIAGFGLCCIAIGLAILFSTPPRPRRRFAFAVLAFMCAQGATASAAFVRAGFWPDAWWMGIVTVIAVIAAVIRAVASGKSNDKPTGIHERVTTRVRTAEPD